MTCSFASGYYNSMASCQAVDAFRGCSVGDSQGRVASQLLNNDHRQASTSIVGRAGLGCISFRQQMLWEWQMFKVRKAASGAAVKLSSESLELDRVICHRARLMLVVLSQRLAKFRFPF